MNKFNEFDDTFSPGFFSLIIPAVGVLVIGGCFLGAIASVSTHSYILAPLEGKILIDGDLVTPPRARAFFNINDQAVEIRQPTIREYALMREGEEYCLKKSTPKYTLGKSTYRKVDQSFCKELIGEKS